MKCNACMKEWSGTPEDVRCPFCGADLGKGGGQHDVPGVIAFLIKKEGVDILLRPDTVTAFISDLVREHERDKKLMRVGTANGVLQRAHAILIEPKRSQREIMVLDMKQHLIDSAFLSERNAEELVIMTLAGIGLPELASVLRKAGNTGVSAQTPDKKEPSGKRTPEKAREPSIPKSDKPLNVRKPPVLKSQNGKFTIQSIRTFAYDGSHYAARKVRGPLFLKGETRMVGILLSFDPVQETTDASVDWQIFRQDGTSVSGPVHGSAVLNAGNTDFYQGWGWQQPGRWEVGRYYIKATMNGSAPVTTYFEVVDGKFDNPVLTMYGARIFTAGSVPPPMKERVYSDSFAVNAACRIYFEISLRAVDRSLYTTINYRILGPDGEIWANYAEPVRFQVGSDRCWTGYGWDVPGHWKKGRYVYELSIGQNGSVLSGVFDII